MKSQWILSPLFLIAACSENKLEHQPSLDAWVSQSLGKEEKLLCKVSRSNDYFFVSYVEPDKLRIGSRLYYSATGDAAIGAVKYWKIENENGEILTGLRPPDSVIQRNPTSLSPYDESVLYFYPTLNNSKKLVVSVDVKRCSDRDCDRSLGTSQAYALRICEAPLKDMRGEQPI